MRGNMLVAVQAQHPPARHGRSEAGGRGRVTHVLRRIPPLLVLWGLLLLLVLLVLRVATTATSPAAGWEAPAPLLPLLAALRVWLLVLLQRCIKDIIRQGGRGVLLRCPIGPVASLGRAIGRLHALVLVLRGVRLVLVLLLLRLVLGVVLCRQLHVAILHGDCRVGAKHGCGRQASGGQIRGRRRGSWAAPINAAPRPKLLLLLLLAKGCSHGPKLHVAAKVEAVAWCCALKQLDSLLHSAMRQAAMV